MPFLSDAALGSVCATGSALTWSLINLLVRSLSPAFNSVALNALRSTVGSVLIVAWIAAMDGLGGLTDMSARAVWLRDLGRPGRRGRRHDLLRERQGGSASSER